MDGDYVRRLSADDLLHDFLGKILRDQAQFGDRVAKFRVFRHVRIICKFYGSRFKSDPGLAAVVGSTGNLTFSIRYAVIILSDPHTM